MDARLKAAIVRGIESQADREATIAFAERICREAGGFLTAEQAAEAAGETTGEILRTVSARRLLAVERDGELRLPAFQFEAVIRERVEMLLAAAPSTGGWALLQFLFAYPEGLAGRRPIDLLAGGEDDAALALRVARALED